MRKSSGIEPSRPSAHRQQFVQVNARDPHVPSLSAEEEQALCDRWRDHHDISAVHQFVGSHRRLVIKIALGYRGHGLLPEELIGEGRGGLMRSVCRGALTAVRPTGRTGSPICLQRRCATFTAS
jgi:DNA-directed RNA polymerase sigma subunit (sigma70/sigma32)